MEGITLTAGHSAIPFGGMRGPVGRWGGEGSGDWAPYGDAGYPGGNQYATGPMVTLGQQALQRYQNAADAAAQACQSQSGIFQTAFNYVTGNTSTQSICAAAAQMQVNIDAYAKVVNDPTSTDDQLAEVMNFIARETDISDLLATAAATNAWTVVGNSLVRAPGTAVGWVANTAGQLGAGILGNIPWWLYALGGLYVASQLGLFKRRTA